MGIVLDSSLLISAERGQHPVSSLLESLASQFADAEFLISSVTVMELEHGFHRAASVEVASRRRAFLDEIFSVIPAVPFTPEMGKLAAKVDAEMKQAGVGISTADLLIGVTALFLDYAVATQNIRHFALIPGLRVIAV
jgi:predicted nucleic acid-binding protein